MSRSTVVEGGVTTRTQRRRFRKRYGTQSYQIVSRWFRGENTNVIAQSLGVSVGTVATTIGNVNRDGNFGNAAELCNF